MTAYKTAPMAEPIARYREGGDPLLLRRAFGNFATGVTVATALDDDGQPMGLTANSFTSLSLDPPLLLLCIATKAASCGRFAACDSFGVNILSADQRPTSQLFATHAADRFGPTDWIEGETGVPLLTQSITTFECAREAVHPGGDHIILVGRVRAACVAAPIGEPLIYFRGAYRRLHWDAD